MSPLLEARDVCFAYGKEPVVSGVSLTLEAGEFLGVTGPNGSGKTTLLRILSGLLQPTTGDVRFRRKNVRDIKRRALAHEMAYVPQSNHIAFSFTAAEIVLMGRFAYLESGVFERHQDLLICELAMRDTDTSDLGSRYFNELSGGEKQRVLIASALAQCPQVLFLDEPTASLDIHYQAQILKLLKRSCRERQQTVVMSIHDLNLAGLFCDRLLMLHRGKLVADGRPAEVLNQENISNFYSADARFFTAGQNGRVFIFPSAEAS